MQQKIIHAKDGYAQLDEWIRASVRKCLFLVCGGSIRKMKIDRYFEELPARSGIRVVRFSAFGPNPSYDSVVEGVRAFAQSGADGMIAVGGGSAMDVAKCIKLYSNMDPDECYLDQEIIPNDIRFLAVPTTAGTGSEATRYAVIYYQGEKQSVTHESCIPDTVLMDAEALRTLPDYHRKAAMMDALCHAVESFWSVNSTDESRGFASEAIRLILGNMDRYLANDDAGNANMLQAAHIAGKAINITQTTAGHAMCYKLTGLYGIAHGHAAALCVSELWPWMLEHMDRCADERGQEYLERMFCDLAAVMGCQNPQAAAGKFSSLVRRSELAAPIVKEEDLAILTRSVNPVRLKNNPVALDENAMDHLYRKMGRRR
ncbi:MAG: phosphonoacetaldehyde reductase [Lachnospiraceae bacterium]|nr:phosphonoacetaldehyde reductase [Butyrivibrio sp.]MCM1342427.1 phosphonoacetaldehyde reductase [Muribaculaceae bacterium]MCM1410266.1 phosphonoacetaldehyde reductase [Lachnospiraceae bacterium]